MPPILRWLTGWAASSVLWVPSVGRRAFSLVATGAGWYRVRLVVERNFPNYSGATRTPRPGGPGRAVSILSVYPGRITVDLFDTVFVGLPTIAVPNSSTFCQVFSPCTV